MKDSTTPFSKILGDHQKTSSLNKPLNILLIDSNRAYAGMVKDVLLEYVRNSHVDVATNIWEVRRRVNDKKPYGLVLADLSITHDYVEIAAELKKIPALVVLWSIAESEAEDIPKDFKNCVELRKPLKFNELQNLVGIPATVA